MLYLAFAQLGSPIAQEIYQQKLMPSYRSGFWDNDRAYYTQNLAWFGIAPVQDLGNAMGGFFPENRTSQKP
jgi:endoglucanase